MKITLIIGPRRSGKLTKARELARASGQVWREYVPDRNASQALAFTTMMQDSTRATIVGCGDVASSFVIYDAHRITAEQFLRVANDALDFGLPIIMTADPPNSLRGEWLLKLIEAKLVEVIELQGIRLNPRS